MTQLVASILSELLFTEENQINEILQFVAERPEEWDPYRYWSWTNDQMCPIIEHIVTQYADFPINFIYIGSGQNSPYTLFQYVDKFFKDSDFHRGNTPNDIYEWFKKYISLIKHNPMKLFTCSFHRKYILNRSYFNQKP